jgi:hypothetical protein
MMLKEIDETVSVKNWLKNFDLVASHAIDVAFSFQYVPCLALALCPYVIHG